MRTMIWLDRDVDSRLKHLAVGINLAEPIRHAVAEFLKEQGKRKGGRDD